MRRKLKHNKKRNTAFLYESLVRELTKTILEKNEPQRGKIMEILQASFGDSTCLSKELECYRNLLAESGLNTRAAEKLVFFTKEAHAKIDKKRLFNEQTHLINEVNKKIGKGVFNTFVPSYKSLATIYQIFNDQTPEKTRVLLEERVLGFLGASPAQGSATAMEPVDNLVFGAFVKRFNEKYHNLHEEQRALLHNYILSFADNGIDLKMYLNEEVGRLKTQARRALNDAHIASDTTMTAKTQQTIELLESLQQAAPGSGVIKTVLKVQSLIREIEE